MNTEVKNNVQAAKNVQIAYGRVSVSEKKAEASREHRKEVNAVVKQGLLRCRPSKDATISTTAVAIWEKLASCGGEASPAADSVFGASADWVALLKLANRKREVARLDPLTIDDVKMECLRKLRIMVAEVHRQKEGKAGYAELVKAQTALGEPGKARKIAQTRFLEQMDVSFGVKLVKAASLGDLADILDLF